MYFFSVSFHQRSVSSVNLKTWVPQSMSRMFTQRSNAKLAASTLTTINAGRVWRKHLNTLSTRVWPDVMWHQQRRWQIDTDQTLRTPRLPIRWFFGLAPPRHRLFSDHRPTDAPKDESDGLDGLWAGSAVTHETDEFSQSVVSQTIHRNINT